MSTPNESAERAEYKARLEADLKDAEEGFKIDYATLQQAIKDCDRDIANIEDLKMELREYTNNKYPDNFISVKEQEIN